MTLDELTNKVLALESAVVQMTARFEAGEGNCASMIQRAISAHYQEMDARIEKLEAAMKPASCGAGKPPPPLEDMLEKAHGDDGAAPTVSLTDGDCFALIHEDEAISENDKVRSFVQHGWNMRGHAAQRKIATLRARVAELEQYNSNLSIGWSRSKEAMDAAQAERDAARAELAALKARKVDLAGVSWIRESDVIYLHKSEVVAAIRAAGVEVES